MLGDTVAAISTPVGEAAIGIVRLSGPDALAVADRVFRCPRGEPLARAATHTVHYGHAVAPDGVIDEVLATVMLAPRTYTREDVVEFGCHGGVVATRAVLEAVLCAGARLAERGEFTQRAFLNGRISLDQAQAVLDVVKAQTRLGLEAAVDRLGGRFSREIAALRGDVESLLADVEVEIDFPDLEIDPVDLKVRLLELSRRTADLLARGEHGRLVREGLTVAILGRPNVGKSTLLNALLAEERSIVAPTPGTTRDTVEEIASIGGIPVRLIDTAGLRVPVDEIEAEGVRRAEGAAARADVVLIVLDRSCELCDEDRALLARDWGVPRVVVRNKTDLADRLGPVPGDEVAVDVSARDGLGLDALRERLASGQASGGFTSRNAVLLLDTWERDLLRRTAESLGRALGALDEGATPDVVAEELRAAHRATGELQGIDLSESILERIFSRFCVGK
ncbi:MAG: tRNA uridine-5-carboxymethylaminomethyl(34) synthesis GTPase MnmE [Candidatus Bipolaricaulota bacterium]